MTRTGEMSLSLGCERETDIGMAASRHANQTDLSLNKYTMKRVKQAVGICRDWKR